MAAVRQQIISIHALREEGDTTFRTPQQSASRFLSTPSARRATESIGDIVHIAQFLSTPSARRATLLTPRGADVDRYFYPRPPRGGRPFRYGRIFWAIQFLSTPSARRATLASLTIAQAILDFYPRPPRGGRPYLFPRHFLYQCISIHALREEGDLLPCSIPFHINLFLSTPSARRATSGAVTIAAVAGFLSTPSARRATLYNLDPRPGRMDFYPRPPRGGRRAVLPGAELPRRISIHALREEGDQVPCVSFPLTS